MHFHNKKIKYVWNSHDSSFEKQPHIDENMKQSQFHKCKEGLGQLTVADRLQEYGENLIRISVPSVVYLVFHEVCFDKEYSYIRIKSDEICSKSKKWSYNSLLTVHFRH